ncbi:MAG: methyltransferase domain-containing protein [Magnetococcales bacterium]|nr:methyltransferase domain-containing protein [Magnetococcales bacterium]
MIRALSKINVIIDRQNRWLVEDLTAEELVLHDKLDSFLAEYCNFHRLTADKAADLFMTFISRFSKDLARFEETGIFAAPQTQPHSILMDRTTYDVSLIISTLVTKHRFEIMKRINQISVPTGNCLVIGVGPGLELLLLEGKNNRIEAYDPTLSAFVSHRFTQVNLIEEFFVSSPTNRYETIFAIELLEHLDNPLQLIEAAQGGLKPGGRLWTTTIKNVPQFDHVYNFTDAANFEKQVEIRGFSLIQKQVIAHEYLMSNLDANNIFYLFETRELI